MYLSACNAPTDSGETGSQNNVSNMGEMDIPANFDWKTHKDVHVKLRGYQSSAVRFLSKDGTVYHQARLIDNNEYSFKLTIPAYMEKITVVYLEHEKNFDLNRQEINHTFGS
jgi:hypothetical protein